MSQKIERIRTWFNEEYQVIETRRKRTNRVIVGFLYLLGILVIVNIIGILELWPPIVNTVFWAIEPITNMFIGTWLETPMVICLIIEMLLVIIIIFSPGTYWMATADTPLDKEFLDDPERTERWRTKRGKNK